MSALALQQTDDAKKMMTTSGTPAFGGIREVSAPLSRADRGGVLSTRELLDVASLLHAAMQISKYGKEQEEKGEPTTLDEDFARIHTNRYLEQKINRAIIKRAPGDRRCGVVRAGEYPSSDASAERARA